MEAVLEKLKIDKYNKYRDSGIEWLNEIPVHWETRRVKFLFSIGRGRVIAQTELLDDGKYPVYSSQTQDNGVLGYIDTYDFDCKQITWTTDGANAGTVFLREGKHNCTNVCGTLKPKDEKQNVEFLAYALQVAAQFYKRPDTNGAKIMNGEMAAIYVTLPPQDEQLAISKYLDHKTKLIDKAISIKEKQIVLLNERRQVLIHNSVTKGLNSKTKMEDSGVEWIGNIPKHWDVKRLKYVFKILKRIAGELGHDVLSITQTGIKVKDTLSGEGQLSMDYSKYQFVNEGDFAMNHMDLLTGWVDISKFNGVISPDYRVFDLIEKNSVKEYMLLLLQLCYKNKVFYAHGQGVSMLGRWRFPAEQFNNFLFPIPPNSEQKEIVEYVKKQSSKTDTIISLKEKEIAKLKEYKTSIISGAVTGKIKVY